MLLVKIYKVIQIENKIIFFCMITKRNHTIPLGLHRLHQPHMRLTLLPTIR